MFVNDLAKTQPCFSCCCCFFPFCFCCFLLVRLSLKCATSATPSILSNWGAGVDLIVVNVSVAVAVVVVDIGVVVVVVAIDVLYFHLRGA